MMSDKKTTFVIAVDGPAASGKGTIVQLLTEQLRGINIYTGGLYRALALECIREQIAFEDSEAVLNVLLSTNIDLGEEQKLGTVATIFLNGEDVTLAIRTPEVALGAGLVAQIPEVRKEMVRRQRGLVDRLVKDGKIVILDGQDAATYIYPEAEFKLFLTASPEERAKRRQSQYLKQDIQKSAEEMLEEIKTRDKRDFGREINPLSAKPEKDGYFLIDSSDLNEQDTKEVIVKELQKRNLL